MILSLARRVLARHGVGAPVLVPCAARAAESPSYTAYFQGRYLTALKLAEQEAAQGSKEAFTLMGEIYEEGLGVPQDFGKAADNYAKAADLGDANAQFSLGALGGRGPRGEERPPHRRRSVRAGSPGRQCVRAIQPRAHLFERQRPASGRGQSRGMDAEIGAAVGNAQAEYDLSAFYQFGRGVPIDKAKAAEWIGRAADDGLPDAEVEYGVMLFNGEGVPADQARAAKLFRHAAEQGNPIAQNRLARLYANGVVVKADPVQAAKWHLPGARCRSRAISPWI